MEHFNEHKEQILAHLTLMLEAHPLEHPLRAHADHICSVAYPESCREELGRVIAMITGSEPFDLACFSHCVWAITGFCLGMVLPHECDVVMQGVGFDWKSALDKFLEWLPWIAQFLRDQLRG